MEDSVKEIPLTQGLVTLVDAADYDYFMQWNWCVEMWGKHYVAVRHVKKKGRWTSVYLHREIIKLHGKNYLAVRHINGNKLDNRLSNLCQARRGLNKFVAVDVQEDILIKLRVQILEEKKTEIDYLKKQRLKVAQMLMGAIEVTRHGADAEILATRLEEILYALRP